LEDVQLPEGNQNFVRITIKEEYSKTLGRVISLYWKHTLDAIREYLAIRTQQGIRPHEPIFAGRYDNSRWFLVRLGRRVLGRSIHYHLFRHSSATYYASKINRQQLCYRYGWRFSSDMPDVYISRAGMQNPEIDEKFQGTEIETLKVQLEKQRQENELMKEWRKQMEGNLCQVTGMDQIISRALQNPQALSNIAKAILKLGLHQTFADDA
jgi:transcription termination factor NusB